MINALSSRLFSWYSSGVFVLIVVILTSVYAVVSDGVSPLIATLFSSVMTLPVPSGSNSSYDDPLVVLNIKPGACSLGGYSPGVYSLSA